jgi:hypothetical protein
MKPMDDPFVQSALVPLAVSAIGAGLLRLVSGSTHGPAMAGAAIAFAYLAGYVLILGAPVVWPPSAMQKVFFIAAAGAVFGLSLDLSREARQVTLLAAALAPALAMLWLGWPRILLVDWVDIGTLVVVAVAGALVLAELFSRQAEPAESGVKLLIASCALALIALVGASASYAQLAGVLAASVAGFLLWLWPAARFRFAASALFGGGLVFVALAGAVAIFSNAPKPALGLLLPIFFADRALGRFDTGINKLNHALKPLLLAVIALIPAIAAVGLSHLLGPGGL